ncbi:MULTISPECIES: CHAT domain-containing protein [Aerosakkonema]|uniref:CHAT domain-containing protein n=1 Tax=Aerosakkonema TaxID=1246629 RepID=UPI0035B95ED8
MILKTSSPTPDARRPTPQLYQILPKQPDKAQALHQAMLTTIEKYPIPRDWAAFTLIGEAEYNWKILWNCAIINETVKLPLDSHRHLRQG